MDASKSIIFYDISPCFACNTWKTRYTLNFKGIHHQTEWVDLPDVEPVRKKLNLPPNRTFWDGSPFYTLPIIQDPASGEVVGDSFDIALYLEKAYTNTPSLFPPSTVGLQAAFNKQIDAVFMPFYILCIYNIPFNPETAEDSRASWVWRMRKEKWEDFNIQGKERARILDEFKVALGEVAKFYSHGEGPFLGGKTPLYADFIIGAWLITLKITLKEWEEVKMWHNGLWRTIHLALEKYAEIK